MSDLWKDRYQNKNVLLQIGIYFLFFFLSIFSLYWVWLKGPTYFVGDDLTFHLSRIEGLSEALKAGEFLPRLNYSLAGGMGYPTGIFYPEFFLYPAALLRVMGASVIHSYQGYLLLLTFVTFIVSYHCFRSIKHSTWGAVVFSIVYTLSSYRLSDVFYRGAVGESLAFLFLPLIYVGIYQIIYGKIHYWWILSLGMTCLIYSHFLSAFIAAIFLFFYGLFSLKPLLTTKERWLSLLKAIGVTIALSLDLFIPMAEQLGFQRLRFQDVSLFYLSKEAESIGTYVSIAWKNNGFNNVGVIMIIGLVLAFCGFKWETKETKKLTLLGWIFFVLATTLFPQQLVTHTLLNTLQFPWRYFLLVSFLVSWVLGSFVSTKYEKIKYSRMIFGLVVIIGTLSVSVHNQFQLRAMSYRQCAPTQYDEYLENANLGYGQEFLPSGMTSWTAPTSLLYEPQKGVTFPQMERNGNSFYLTYKVEQPTRLIYPLLYYKGYLAEVNGQRQSVEKSSSFKGKSMNGFVQVTVEGSGTVLVWYEGTLLQRISRWVTFSSWVFFLCYVYVQYKGVPKWIGNKNKK